jgi:hypothetical protein
MVRATTLAVTSESTHRLPPCSSCLFTFPIHSNNAYGLNISRWVPRLLPTHRSNTSRVHSPRHSATQYDTTRHDTTRRDRRLLTLPILPPLSYDPSYHPIPIPIPIIPIPNPAPLASLIPISNPTPSHLPSPRTPSARLSTGNRQRGTVRPAAARERRGARCQTQRGSEAATHQGFVARVTIATLTQIPDTKDGDQDRQFRRLRHNYL